MQHRRIRTASLWLGAALYMAGLAHGGEAEAQLEGVLDADTCFALFAPDLSAARARMGQTRLAAMLARPELQAFFEPIRASLHAEYNGLRDRLPPLAALEQAAGLLQGGRAAVAFKLTRGEDFGGAVYVDLRDAERLNAFLAERLGGPLPPDGLPLPMLETSVVQAGSGLLLARPAAELPAVTARLKDGGLALTAEQAAYKDALVWGFFHPGQMLRTAMAAAPEADRVKAEALAKALGLPGMGAWSAGLRVDSGEWIGEAHLASAAPNASMPVLELIYGREPIRPESLKLAAKDAPFVSAWRVNLAGIVPLIFRCADAIGEGPALAEGWGALTTMLGMDLQEDFLAHFEGECVTAATRLDTAQPLSWGPGMVSAFRLKDPAKLTAGLVKLKAAVERLAAAAGPGALPLIWREQTVAGKTVQYLRGDLLGGGLSFRVEGDSLLVANSLNAMRRTLEQLQAPDDIRAHPGFRTTLERLTGAPYADAALPPGFAFSDHAHTGSGLLLTAGAGVAAAATALCAAADRLIPADPNPPPGPAPGIFGNPLLGEALLFLGKPSGQMLTRIAHSIDLGFWPDAGFFAEFQRPSGFVLLYGPGGWRMRGDLPPPAPGGQSTTLVAVATVGIGAGLLLPAMARSREQARRTHSAINLSQFGKACFLYADVDVNRGRFPRHPAELAGAYVSDPRLFVNPRSPESDPGYMYLAGSTPADGDHLVAYDALSFDGLGRNVLYADGHVEWLDEFGFNQELERTAKQITDAGRKARQIPVRSAEIAQAFANFKAGKPPIELPAEDPAEKPAPAPAPEAADPAKPPAPPQDDF
ncbi:MAG: hypothetical protein HS116_10785 [Planctomycetes bacterium]|nr:hypothetical protein [Planctomycetota bacterium]